METGRIPPATDLTTREFSPLFEGGSKAFALVKPKFPLVGRV
jgi:hypothetical protein